MCCQCGPGQLDGSRVHRRRHIGNIILYGQRPGQAALRQVAEVEAGVDGQDLGGQQAVVDGAEGLWRRVPGEGGGLGKESGEGLR